VCALLQTIELPDANERAAVAADPLASLERQTLAARKAAAGRTQLVALAAEREAKGRDPYSLNKTLRAAMRQAKKADVQLDTECVECAGLHHVGRAAAARL
jgi:coiled-coil domain-containing protein 130